MNTIDKFENLNTEQKTAMLATDGAVLVTAGAGSGKTRLLTHRIAYLLEKMQILPENILAITFTNKASNEMKERVTKITPNGQYVWISTFHSMCVRILRSHIEKLDPSYNRNFSIYSDTDGEKLLKTLVAEKNLTDNKIIKNVLFHLSNMKNNNRSILQYSRDIQTYPDCDTIIDLMQDYEEHLRENNALDFDDLLVKTYSLFRACPEVLKHYATRFRYILVDEFQDTNMIQYELVKALSSIHKNIFVVGDEDQCIYTWRGANFKNINNFTKDFDNVQIFKLEQNYRSTKTILQFANKLIKHNKSRIDKTLWCDNPDGEPVKYKQLYDEQGEADFVAKTIHDLVANKGCSYNDFAILVRFNALTFPFEEKLLSYNIPHKIYGGFKFYERAEIKDVLAYLKLFINPKDEQAFIRIINFPKRGIGDTSIQKIREIAVAYGTSSLDVALNPRKFGIANALAQKLEGFAEKFVMLLKAYETQPLDDFAKQVVKTFGIEEAFNDKLEEELNKILNIQQLIHSIENFAKANPFDTLSDYLQSVSLISDMDSMDSSDNVIVATVHAVKGLEFRVVFLVGLEESVFPISRALNSDEELEEERRLMYVGITRAKEKLYVSSCKTRFLYGRRNRMLESRFIADAGLARTPQKTFESEFSFGANPFASNKSFGGFGGQVDYIKTSSIADTKSEPKAPLKFKPGQTVVHTRFGKGKLLEVDYEERTGDIDFESVGVKTLMLDIAPLTIEGE